MNSLNLQHSPFSKTKPPAGSQLNWGHPLSRALVGCWLFNEGSGKQSRDITGLSGSVTTSTAAFSTGRNGSKAASFNAAAQKFSTAINSPSLIAVNALTIESWFYYSNWNNYNQFVSKSGGLDTAGWYFRLPGTGTSGATPTFNIAIGGVSKSITGGAIAVNQWHHIVGTYNGATVTLYINGKASGTPIAATGVITDSNNPLGIGCVTDTFTGMIDLVRVWKERALIQPEILQLYNEPFCMLRGPR